MGLWCQSCHVMSYAYRRGLEYHLSQFLFVYDCGSISVSVRHTRNFMRSVNCYHTDVVRGGCLSYIALPINQLCFMPIISEHGFGTKSKTALRLIPRFWWIFLFYFEAKWHIKRCKLRFKKNWIFIFYEKNSCVFNFFTQNTFKYKG